MKKIGIFLIIGLFISISLLGCKKERMESCITIEKDGRISQRIVENFEKDYYDLDELKNMTENEITTYLSGAKENSVELSQALEKDGKVIMVLNYDSYQSYNGFNSENLFVGSVKQASEAENENFFKDVSFVDAKTKNKKDAAEVLKDSDRTVVIFDEKIVFETEKKIVYYSENVELDTEKSGKIKKDAKGIGYIIY